MLSASERADGVLKKFACEYSGCEKVYSKKGNLQVHIKTFHEKVLKEKERGRPGK